MTIIEEENELFLSSAQEALRSTNGEGALLTLGWRDLLDSLDDVPDARLGVFAYFQAQGRELGSSRALGELMAHPYAVALGEERSLTASVERRSAQRGSRCIVVGEPTGGVLIDRPGYGIARAELNALDLRPVGLSDGLVLHEIESDLTRLPVSLNEAQAVPLRSRSTQLGRVALAYEILGAAETTLATAVQYASDRMQFGQPIGHFQAVRHLLASARVDDIAGLASLTHQSAYQYPALPSMRDSILKALAGRNGKRICESSLQVLGAIGFTTEHEHHRFHSRVLVLDSLLGTSSTLTHQIAVTLRASAGTVPDLYPSVEALRGL